VHPLTCFPLETLAVIASRIKQKCHIRRSQPPSRSSSSSSFMNTSPQSERLTVSAQLHRSVAGELPIELVLSVVDHAIALHRQEDPERSLSLSLVCRIVRASILPIVYKIVYIDIREKIKRDFTGWDGRIYQRPHFAFLSWLIHDPTGPPR